MKILPLIFISFSLSCAATLAKPLATEPSPVEVPRAPGANQAASRGDGFDAELNGFDYPFPVKTFKFESQGENVSMAYMDIEPSVNPNGKTVLLFHGKNFGGFYFDRIAKDLAAKGYRVVIPDQIGFGKSSKPEHYQYSFAQLARSTHDLLESIGVREFTLVGHSMGGMLATRYALLYPDSVQKFILINPIGLEDYRMLTSYKTIDEQFQNEFKANEETIKKYQNESYYDGKWKPAYDALIVPAVGWTKGPDRQRLAYTAALTSDMVYNQPVVHEFKNIKAKTVLIIGQRDRTAVGKGWASPENQKKMGDYPKLGRAAAKAIPKSKLIELPGLGHVPFVEDYDRFAAVFFKEF